MICILKFKNNKINNTLQKLEYRRLNIYNAYRDYNGYVFKVIGVFDDNIEGEYYNDHKKTYVPVLNGDYLILSKYVNEPKITNRASYYKLLFIDFSLSNNIREIMTIKENKYTIYEYLTSNNLVGTVTPEYTSLFQIEKTLVEYFKNFVNLHFDKNKSYSTDDISSVLNRNIYYKDKIYTLDEYYLQHNSFSESESSYQEYIRHCDMLDAFRLSKRLVDKISIIFELSNRSFLTINEMIHYAEVCSYNYEYNL